MITFNEGIQPCSFNKSDCLSLKVTFLTIIGIVNSIPQDNGKTGLTYCRDNPYYLIGSVDFYTGF